MWREAEAGVDRLCVELCEEEAEGGMEGLGGGEELLLLWCWWLLRCCYRGVSSVLRRAVYWSDIAEAPQALVVAVERGASGAGDTMLQRAGSSSHAVIIRRESAGCPPSVHMVYPSVLYTHRC